MSEAVVDDIVAMLPPLLQSLEALGFIARHLNPPDFGRVMEAAGSPDQALLAELPRLAEWPEQFSDLRAPLQTAGDAALKAFEGVKAELALAVRPQADGDSYSGTPSDSGKYPNPTVINNYYTEQGPPVVTYYAPPPDYYYLYGWVPSPFWWSGFWFPGFFILNDFHRTVFIHNRPFFVSNHFNDIRRHRVFRIDPADRFHGRTFAGIGVTHSRGFISTGVPRSGRVIFNGSRRTSPSGVSSMAPSGRGSRSMSATPRASGISGQPSRGARMGGTSSRSAGGSMQRSGGSSLQQRGGRR